MRSSSHSRKTSKRFPLFASKEKNENQSLLHQNDRLKEENMKCIEKINNLADKVKIVSADNELLAKDRVKLKHVINENHELKLQLKVSETQIATCKNNYKKTCEMLEKSKSEIEELK